MSARTLFIPLVALTLGLVLAAACGGGGDGAQPTGRLTDPDSVPTATPWVDPPEPVILEPGALTPTAEEATGDEQDGGENGGAEDGAEGDGTISSDCGDTYTVQSGDVPFTIAEKCGVDPDKVREWVNKLLEINNIDDPTTLRVGQELEIPQ